ncbi:IclR family transcriptional regulator [Rhodobacter sp. NTK016B]|uniref:IclR family transcriptional regulator n=1 Tax=Rhodobacter sp. NTK016B TaxID=2759676 RepID=UPI001A8C92BD|nr:IclR family transcriptional regulator [Rhodobacter sp. NTK016B]MBN8291155.1 IclR family transcriptional regulator [Rhodobacter sp. NTK016B]
MDGDGKPKGAEYSVPPVERALKLLRHIGDGNTCRNLSATSEALGINRTTLIRLIHTLTTNRMIEEIANGAGYRLGVGLITLGSQAMHGRDLVQVCQPVLAELCAETGMSAHMGILDGPDIVYLSRETPNTHLVSNVRAGSRLAAHASSIGRAILAELSEDQIAALFADAPLPANTSKTPVTVSEVLEQARADKAMGVAWSEGNFEAGIGSCAAAIFDHQRVPVGALNVSGPQSAFSTEAAEGSNQIKKAVRDAALRASQALGYMPRA